VTPLRHGRLPWPAFVPMHDSLRDAYCGVAAPRGAAVRLQADAMHAARGARQLASLSGQLRAFADLLRPHDCAAASACMQACGGIGSSRGRASGAAAVLVGAAACKRLPAATLNRSDKSKSVSQQQWKTRRHLPGRQ
jgi:hypothetical protein